MKRNIVVTILLLLTLGIAVDVTAQKAKKKAGSGTTKKGGKKGSKATPAAEPTPDPVAATPAPADQPVIDEVPVPAEDTGVTTPDIVAEDEKFDFSSIEVDTTKPTDGYYKMSNLKGAKPFPFPKEDKNSVKFYKRIWREINTNDSENRIFSIPGETLIQFLMDGIKAGKLYAYEDDGFKKKLTYRQVIGKFKDSSIQTIIDSTGEITGTKTVANEFNPDSITRFEIKEDIYFDKVRGRVVTEIISMGPIKKLKTTTGVEISDSHPFYLRFDQSRRLLAAKEVVDPQRDIYNISFDDVFLQRAFKSTIIKESNPSNMRIKDKYPDRARQIKESNRIEREIQRYKRNLWKFN